jgi:hypothetical protein
MFSARLGSDIRRHLAGSPPDCPHRYDDLDKDDGDECQKAARQRVLGAWARLDEPPSHAPASTFIRKKEPDRSCADDQNIDINCGLLHDLLWPIPQYSGGTGWFLEQIGHTFGRPRRA